MAGALDYLFNGQPPPAVTTSTAANNGLPDWYNSYVQGIAGKATDIAGNTSSDPVPQQSTAGFNPYQTSSFENTRKNIGAWAPELQSSVDTANGITGQSAPYLSAATKAVQGPAGAWTDPGVASSYMSPYTDSVVQNIARLGNRNFNENLMPTVNNSMIGNGQFGSTRNADILSRAARDTQADISGQQAGALEQGYGVASNIFGADANRFQQQQQMQASTNLGAAAAGTNAAVQQAQQQGALTQTYAGLNAADSAALAAAGSQQQQQQQRELDATYANATNTRNDPWAQLNNVNSAVRGMQINTTPTTASSGPASVYAPSPLASVAQLYGWNKAATPAPVAATQ